MAQLATTNICGDLTISGGLKAGENITLKGGNVAPLFFKNGYWGMGLPDGTDSDWIRTPLSGIIPWAAGGSGALGTSSWPFNNIFSKALNVDGNVRLGPPGTLIIDGGAGNFAEGIRINKATGGWATLIMGAPLGSTAGTADGAWSIHSNPDGNFAIVNGGSNINAGLGLYKNGDIRWRNNRIWNQGNDGAGSGLDADLLDGLNSTDFARAGIYSSVTDLNTMTTSGIYRINAAYPNMPAGLDHGQLLVLRDNGVSDTIAQLGFCYSSDMIYLRRGTTTTFKTTPWKKVWVEGNLVTSAVWNDYAELFEKEEKNKNYKAGYIIEAKDNGTYGYSSKKESKTVVGIVSDNYGFLLGGEKDVSEEENLRNYIPIGLAGRLNIYITGQAKIGDLIIASDIPGVGIVSSKPKPGTIVGKVLENKNTNEIGKVKMLIMLS